MVTTQPKTTFANPVGMVQIRQNGDQIKVHQINDGTSLIVGSDESCGLILDQEGVAGKHCVLRMADGEIFISDWYSESGTLINGEKIYVETCLRELDEVTLGPYQLRFVITSSMQKDSANFEHPYDKIASGKTEKSASNETVNDDSSSDSNCDSRSDSSFDTPGDHVSSDVVDVGQAPVASVNTAVPDVGSSHGMMDQLLDANATIENLKQELEYQISLQTVSEPSSDNSAFDPMQANDTEMMRAEIEFLQQELESRDQEIQTLAHGKSVGDNDEVNDIETGRLVERLEQLLDELCQSDQHQKSLEEALLAADEAVCSETEERRQLEQWVSEIEDRVIEREQEWKLREEKLRHRIEEADKRVVAAEEGLRNAMGGKYEELQRSSQSRIAELRTQNSALEASLEQTRSEFAGFRQLVEKTSGDESSLESLGEKMNQIRNHEVEMAQERASLARQTAELAKMREQLEKDANNARLLDEHNPDIKVRAFRQHLKQIHEQEKQERKSRRGLTARISNLWNRLEDR